MVNHPWVQSRVSAPKNMLASFMANFSNCQIIFLVGVCLKSLPLKCGLGNILDELLAQTCVFLCENG